MPRQWGAATRLGRFYQIDVAVKADGFTPNDPSELFFGQTLSTLRAAANGDTAPRYAVDTFGALSDYLMVEVQATQDGSSSLALEATISVELVLDDGPIEWTPAQLEPVGWWRADLGHTATDGSPVSAWANQGSDANLDVSQGTGTRQPTYVASEPNLNGQPALDYDDDVLSTAATSAWELADGESLTAVVVCWPDFTGSKTAWSTTNPGQGGILQLLRTDAGSTLFDVEDASGTSVGSSLSTASPQTPTVLAGVFDASTSPQNDEVTFFLNGSAGPTNSADLGAIEPSAGSGTKELNIGGNAPTGDQFIGQIAEVLYHKAVLTAAQDTNLTRYLNQRYGLSLSSVTR